MQRLLDERVAHDAKIVAHAAEGVRLDAIDVSLNAQLRKTRRRADVQELARVGKIEVVPIGSPSPAEPEEL